MYRFVGHGPYLILKNVLYMDERFIIQIEACVWGSLSVCIRLHPEELPLRVYDQNVGYERTHREEEMVMKRQSYVF